MPAHHFAEKPPTVAIVGGGLAGIAAAAALGQAGFNVTLLESRQSLGGRSTSYCDAESGAIIDNCQHVSMGCCTNLQHLCVTLQLEGAFRTEQELYFVSPSGTCTPFRADSLPAPLHLTRAFWRLPYLSLMDKWKFARAVNQLAAATTDSLRGQNFQNWLKTHGQTDTLIRNVWEVVLVSALSESLDRVDAAYARKVFVDGFLTNTQGWKIKIPQVSLDELYSKRARNALHALGVDVQLESRASSLISDSQRVTSLLLKEGREIIADEFILAVPQHHLGPLLSTQPALHSLAEQVRQIETAPITSVHLWFDRPITHLPHAVLVDRLGQWLFARGEAPCATGTEYLYQVVISASRQLAGMTQTEVIEKIVGELRAIWPASSSATLQHARLITERRAVFSATPGIDRLRPPQQTLLENLQLAGDWTQTGWPATMEGAVRSGYLAATNVLRRHGIHSTVVQPSLSRGWMARCLWGKQ